MTTATEQALEAARAQHQRAKALTPVFVHYGGFAIAYGDDAKACKTALQHMDLSQQPEDAFGFPIHAQDMYMAHLQDAGLMPVVR